MVALTPEIDWKSLAEPVYIAGPMTGIPERNYPLFRRVEELLVDLGLKVINPCKPDDHHEDTHPWTWYMRRAIGDLIQCHAIVMLPGWHNSRGARIEHRLAQDLGLRIIYLPVT